MSKLRTKMKLRPEPTDFGGGSQLRRQRRPRAGWLRARVNLPPLTTEEAVLFIEILDRMTGAIWRAHGDDIADFMGRVDPDTMYGWKKPEDGFVLAPPEGDPPLTDF